MSRYRLLMAVALCAVLSCGVWGQQDGIIQHWDFETSVDGWGTLDSQAKWGRTDAADVRFRGDWVGELAFTQRLPEEGKDDDIPGVILAGIPDGAPGLASVRFAVATAFSTPVIVGLNEKDGSSYQATAWSEAGEWHECALSIKDFTLERGSSDENGKLDLDQLETLSFLDGDMVGRVLAKMGIPFFIPEPAQNTIWLDEVILSSEPLDSDATADDLVIDPCASETIQWLPIGAESIFIEAVPADGDEPAHYKFDYVIPSRSVFGLARQVRAGALDGCTGISLQVRCEMDANLFLVVEDENDQRYVSPLRVASTPTWQTEKVLFSSFRNEETLGRTSGALQPGKIRQVFIADILAMEQETLSANVWRIRDIRGLK